MTTPTNPWSLPWGKAIAPAGPDPSGKVIPAEEIAVSRSLMATWVTRFARALFLAFVFTGVMVVSANAQSITYVANCDSDNVSVIYTATHEILNPPVRATIPIGTTPTTPDQCPTAVAFTPYRVEGNANGQFAYLTNKTSDTVSVIDTAKNAVVDTLTVGDEPVAVTIKAVCLNLNGGACNMQNELEGTYAYVANYGSDSVSIINTDPDSPQWNDVTTVSTGIGDGPSAIAISKPLLEPILPSGMRLSSGFFVYVTNSLDDTVSVIDANPGSATFHEVIATVDLNVGANVGLKPMAVVFDRTGDVAYVANYDSDNVTAIDTNTHTANTWIPVGDQPTGLALTIDFTGSNPGENFRLYVANYGSDSFSMIAIEPGYATYQTVVHTTQLRPGDHPTGVSILYPDEDFVYITLNGSSSVSVIDGDPDSDPLQYNQEVGRVPVGGHPNGIANTPRIPYAYVANTASNSITILGASPQIGDEHLVLATIPLNFSPSWMSLHRNQDFLFILDKAAGRVWAINTIALTVVASTDATGPEALTGVLTRPTMPPDGCCMYVTSNNNKIFAIDTDETISTGPVDPGFISGRLGLIATISNPCTSGGKPGGLDTHPSNFRLYVACDNPSNVLDEVVVIDAHEDLSGGSQDGGGAQNGNGGSGQTGGNGSNQGASGGGNWNKIIGRIKLPAGTNPTNANVTHAGHQLYVLNANGTVTIIDTLKKGLSGAFHPVIRTTTLGTTPTSVAFSEHDAHAYITNAGSGSISVITVKSGTVLTTIWLNGVGPDPLRKPQDVFINLGERTAAYVANMGDGTVTLIDTQPGNPTFNTILDVVTVGASPQGLIITEP